jgi:MFS family permease
MTMDQTMSIDDQKSNFRWLVLALLFLNIFIGFIGIQCIPPLFTEIGAEIPLTKTQMGLIMGILTLPSILFSPVGGAFTDRFGSRWAFSGAILVVAVAGAFRGIIDSANGLVVCMFFVGIGTATIAPNISKSLSMWFPKNEFAMANGICLLAMPLASVLGMGTAAGILSPFLGGWRNVMIVPGFICVLTAFLWMVLFRDRKVQEAPGTKKTSFKENFRTVLKIKAVWLSTLFYSIRFIATSSLLALLPIMLSERGLTPGKAGAFVAIMMGSNSLFKIIGGTASDKLGRRKPFLIICTLVQSLCVFAFAIFNGVPLIIALVIAGVCMGCIAPVFMASLVETEGIGPALAGTTVGLVFMIGNIGGFVGPILSGKLMDVTGAQWPGLIFMGLCFFAAAFIIIPLKDTGVKKNKETANAQ